MLVSLLKCFEKIAINLTRNFLEYCVLGQPTDPAKILPTLENFWQWFSHSSIFLSEQFSNVKLFFVHLTTSVFNVCGIKNFKEK